MNLQQVAGGKKFLELFLEAVNCAGYPPDKENPDHYYYYHHISFQVDAIIKSKNQAHSLGLGL